MARRRKRGKVHNWKCFSVFWAMDFDCLLLFCRRAAWFSEKIIQEKKKTTATQMLQAVNGWLSAKGFSVERRQDSNRETEISWCSKCQTKREDVSQSKLTATNFTLMPTDCYVTLFTTPKDGVSSFYESQMADWFSQMFLCQCRRIRTSPANETHTITVRLVDWDEHCSCWE